MSASAPTPARTDVAILAAGIVTAAGPGLGATRSALREGRSGLGRLTLFDSPCCGHFPVAQVAGVERRPRSTMSNL